MEKIKNRFNENIIIKYESLNILEIFYEGYEKDILICRIYKSSHNAYFFRAEDNEFNLIFCLRDILTIEDTIAYLQKGEK